MGLDMYLCKKTYVQRWSHQKKEEKFYVSVKRGSKAFRKIKPKRINYVVEELMDWCKANQIHGWFVNNCSEIQEHVNYYVTLDNLKELLETCKTVLELLNKTKLIVNSEGEECYEETEEIMELLPPCVGFFFGSNTIDKYYRNNIKYTIKGLEAIIEEYDEYDSFEYHASW